MLALTAALSISAVFTMTACGGSSKASSKETTAEESEKLADGVYMASVTAIDGDKLTLRIMVMPNGTDGQSFDPNNKPEEMPDKAPDMKDGKKAAFPAEQNFEGVEKNSCIRIHFTLVCC